MKKYLCIFGALWNVCLFAGDMEYQISKEIQPHIEILVRALNNSDDTMLATLIADNATTAAQAIPDKIPGHTIYYTAGTPTYTFIDTGTWRASWKITSESSGVNGHVSMNGFSHYAVFEKQDDVWKIVDGNFDPTSIKSFFWIFGIVGGIFALIILPLSILWICMLVHAAKYDIHNKTTWIILLCLLGFPVAVVYFFTERKRFKTASHLDTTPESSLA